MAAAATINSSRRLVLYFDVNKTVVMLDPAGGKSFEMIINEIICERAWGTVSEAEDGTKKWTASTFEVPLEPPAVDAMYYKSFVNDVLYPFAKLDGTEDANDVRKQTQAVKDLRRELTGFFVNEGKDGEGFKALFEQLTGALRYPTDDRDIHFLVPALFELIVALVKSEQEFDIVFRTFGDDIAELKETFNEFCEGKHPGYPDVKLDGSDGSRDLRLHFPAAQAVLYRDADNIILAEGTTDKAPLGEGAAFYAGRDDVTVHEGIQNVYSAMTAMRERGTHAVRDYYEWWAANQEAKSAGKLFLIDQEDTSIHQIFFDDNIRFGEEREYHNIVDPRDLKTGESLEIASLERVHLFEPKPLEVILDKNYYVDAVNECVANLALRTST